MGRRDGAGAEVTLPKHQHWLRSLRYGDHGEDVQRLRRQLGMPPADVFDESVEARVKGFQLTYGLTPTGEVDLWTQAELERRSTRNWSVET